MIVLATDTVVQIFAMMIEMFYASIAGMAVIARSMNEQIAAFFAMFGLRLVISFIDAQQDIINRVTAGQIEIVDDYDDEKDIGECEHDPKNGGILLRNCGCDEDAVQDDLNNEQYDGQYLLRRWLERISIDFNIIEMLSID